MAIMHEICHHIDAELRISHVEKGFVKASLPTVYEWTEFVGLIWQKI